MREGISLLMPLHVQALHYYNVIQARDRRHACINELVLDTREFDLLLGSISPEGHRKVRNTRVHWRTL